MKDTFQITSISIMFFLIFEIHAFSAMPPGINWYNGSVEKAFQQALKEKKPIFLYWGAIWCPPCNQIKKNIFTQKSFQEKVKGFVSIYLDGDSPDAPIWGEKLKATGYPTLLILSPSGKEITRITTMGTIDQFLSTLDLGLTQKDNNKNILELIHESPEKFTKDDWTRLSTYAWSQDETFMNQTNKIETIKRLYFTAPQANKYNQEIKSNILNTLFDFIEDEIEDSDQLILKYLTKEEQNKIYEDQLDMILKHKSSQGVNYLILLESSKTVIKYFTSISNEKITHLSDKTKELISSLKKESSLNNFTKIAIPLLEIEIERAKNKQYTLSDSQKKEILLLVESIDKQSKDSFSRQSLISKSINLLTEIGLNKEAKNMALKEISISDSPFYFMSYLGDIEKEEGNIDKSLEWYKKAWKNAKGSSTKIAWGATYLNSLLDLTPQNEAKIINELDFYFKDLSESKAIFAGRNKKTLTYLTKQIKEWKKDMQHKEAINKIQKMINGYCSKIESKTCDSEIRIN